jgi:outer membrane protein assembly factor BamA
VVKFLIAALCYLTSAIASAQACVPQSKPPNITNSAVLNLIFENASLLSPEQQSEISKASANGDDASERVRIAYEDAGYFKVRVESKTVPVPGDSAKDQEIVVEVLDSGQQYRLGELHFAGVHAFSESQLRSVFARQPGDIFSRAIVARGLDKLHQLYGSRGYVNFTAFPDAQFDQNSATANLTIDIDEGRQVHLRDIKVVTVNSVIKARVLDDIGQAPGQVFDSEAWDRLFEKIQAFLPNATPDIIKRNLDERGGWVDVVLDFRYRATCP